MYQSACIPRLWNDSVYVFFMGMQPQYELVQLYFKEMIRVNTCRCQCVLNLILSKSLFQQINKRLLRNHHL